MGVLPRPAGSSLAGSTTWMAASTTPAPPTKQLLASTLTTTTVMRTGAGDWPGWQTRWDAYFAIGCGHNPAIGFSSYHNNGREDRVWRIRCGHRYALRM